MSAAVELHQEDTMAKKGQKAHHSGLTFEYAGHTYTKSEYISELGRRGEIVFKPDEVPFESVGLCAFLRSGNIMLRNYIEKISSLYTGYDLGTHPEYDVKGKNAQEQAAAAAHIGAENATEGVTPEQMAELEKLKVLEALDSILTKPLFDGGLRGEGLRGSDVWVTQTYFPGLPSCTQYPVQKTILLARNPYDSFYSLFHLIVTGTHTDTAPEDVFQAKINEFYGLIQQVLPVFKGFYEFWLKAPVPVHIVRYEDLVEKPVEALSGIFQFLLEEETLNPETAARIQQVVQKSQEGLKKEAVEGKDERVIYKPRSGKVLNSLKFYDEENKKMMREELGEYLRTFMYLGHSTPAHRVLFEEETDKGTTKDTEDFITEFNRKSLAKVCQYPAQYGTMKEMLAKAPSVQMGNEEQLIAGNDFAGSIIEMLTKKE